MSLRHPSGAILSALGPSVHRHDSDTVITSAEQLLDWPDEDEADTEIMPRNPERLDTVIARVLAQHTREDQ